MGCNQTKHQTRHATNFTNISGGNALPVLDGAVYFTTTGVQWREQLSCADRRRERQTARSVSASQRSGCCAVGERWHAGEHDAVEHAGQNLFFPAVDSSAGAELFAMTNNAPVAVADIASSDYRNRAVRNSRPYARRARKLANDYLPF